MVAAQLYNGNVEWKQHETAIQGLAKELGMPLPDISRVYREALTELESHAKIKDFLSVFASRRVRELIKHR